MSAGPREQTTEPASEVIQAAIEKHMWCECPDGGGYNPKHVAAAVVAALGLEEETQEFPGFGRAEPLQARRRWVSGWSVVGGEPK